MSAHESNGVVTSPPLLPGAMPRDEYERMVAELERQPILPPTEEEIAAATDAWWALQDDDVQKKYAGLDVVAAFKRIVASGTNAIEVHAEAVAKTGLPPKRLCVVQIPSLEEFLWP